MLGQGGRSLECVHLLKAIINLIAVFNNETHLACAMTVQNPLCVFNTVSENYLLVYMQKYIGTLIVQVALYSITS